jgi:hypothetical protein
MRHPPAAPHTHARALAPALALLLPLWGCGGDDAPPASEAGVPSDTPAAAASAEDDPQAAFLLNLSAHCGQAFPGRLVFEPEGDPMLTGTEELLVHFRDCDPEGPDAEVRIPFHVEVEATGDWDRSRTWYVMAVPQGLELRHDHREPDGSESTRTWYGGFSVGEGTATRQDFASPQRSERAGVPVGWRIEIEPGAHYRYGTTWDGEFDWLIEFDLSAPVEGPIPHAWGHETPPTRNPGPP